MKAFPRFMIAPQFMLARTLKIDKTLGRFEGLDFGGEPRLEPGGRVAVNDVSGGSPIELLGNGLEFSFGKPRVLGLDGLADLADLSADSPLERTIVCSPRNILPESFCCTFSVWHLLAVFLLLKYRGLVTSDRASHRRESFIVADFGHLV